VFTDNVENMLFRQAVPSVLSDQSAVMVTVGSDIGELHENHEDEFFEAGGRAADAATACYNYFAQRERGFGHVFDREFFISSIMGKLTDYSSKLLR
jgi:hypothetical protein